MNQTAYPTPPASPAPAMREDASRLWHLGWAIGVLAGAALALSIAGVLPRPSAAALALAGAPGLVGYLWRPVGRGRLGLLAIWAAGEAAAIVLQGGPAGPLGAWCVLPLLAGALVGALGQGVAFAGAVLAVGVLVQLGGGAAAPGPDLFDSALAAIGLACAGGAAAAVLFILRRREAEPPGGEIEAAPDRIAELEARLKAAELDRDRAREAQSAADAAKAEADAAREAAEANARAKSRFLANMSHELRTPLNAIMGFSDIMRAKMFGELPGKYAEYADLIHDSGRHLMDLINDVLDMSKIEADRYALAREVFDAREAVNAALRIMRLQADDAGVSLRGVLTTQPLAVDADRRALKQIVLNLVSNALKFTPRGGSVTVTAQRAAGAFELVVADTGVGISRADLERLGQPFEQAGDAAQRAQGTGLGLSLVKAFAGLHGGDMTIESEPGEGAAVTVRLPVLVDEAPSAPAAGGGGGEAAPPPYPEIQGAARPSRTGEVISLNLSRP